MVGRRLLIEEFEELSSTSLDAARFGNNEQ
jgi:hypothetical protein